MAALYEVEDASSMKNQRLRSIRLIELSDHIIRLNRRENTQLELRIHHLEKQQTAIQRNYDREIYWKRLQLAQIYESLYESSDYTAKTNRVQTPTSFYAIKMRRNQSAPPNMKRPEMEAKQSLRPNTTPFTIRRNKRAMSVFKEITLKPSCQTIGDMLLLLGNDKKPIKKEWPVRSRNRLSLRKKEIKI